MIDPSKSLYAVLNDLRIQLEERPTRIAKGGLKIVRHPYMEVGTAALLDSSNEFLMKLKTERYPDLEALLVEGKGEIRIECQVSIHQLLSALSSKVETSFSIRGRDESKTPFPETPSR